MMPGKVTLGDGYTNASHTIPFQAWLNEIGDVEG